MKMDELYKQLIIDHYRHPRNYGEINDMSSIRLFYKNPTCGDTIVLYLLVDQGQIHDIKFEGDGCSISMASCSMMTSAVKGRSLEEAENLTRLFSSMITIGISPEDEALEESLSLLGVHSLRARHNCALMGWQALRKVINQYKNDDSPTQQI